MTVIPNATDPGFRPEDLPPLPKITSDTILLQVYTHRSVYARPNHLFEDPPEDPSPDNERLEHLGDSVLGLCMTTLIRNMYPHIRVGPATKIRAIVVGNPTLAAIAVRYQMHKILRLHPSQAVTLRASANIQADVFESYIAGVYLTRGLDIVILWLTALMRPYVMLAYRTIRAEYGLPTSSPSSDLPVQVPTPPESPPTESPECGPTDALVPPIGSLSLAPIQNGIETPSDFNMAIWPASVPIVTPPTPEGTTSGHLSLLNQYLQQRNTAIDWIWANSEPLPGMSTPKWRVEAMLGGKCLGTGEARTKKAAKNLAAIDALKVLGVDV